MTMGYFLILCLCIIEWCVCEDQQNYTVFDTKQDCQLACVGDHDLDCAISPKGDGQQHVCRCSSGYYSRMDYCRIECEDSQFWSLFTYGLCSEFSSSVLPGACNKQCVFRVRVWATVFVIIVFVAAVIVILVMLPNLIVTCVACCRIRRQERHIEDLQIVGSDLSSTAPKGAHAQPMMTSWNNPYYAAYSGYGGRH